MKKATGQPWMPAAEYGRALRGLTINLVVRDVAAALPFAREVLGAKVLYDDPDFAIFRAGEAEWIIHADHAYDDHPLYAWLLRSGRRGVGAELRLHGRDPDEAAAAAKRLGYTVLAEPRDRPHGLREAFILDPDGYVWVPDVPSHE